MAWLRSVLSEEEEEKLEPLFRDVQGAVALSGLVLTAWALGRALSVAIVKTLLAERAQGAHPWPRCPVCGTGLESKGFQPRQVLTLLGMIGWRRRVGRCPQRCAIGQTVPFDEALGLSTGQKTSAEVHAMGCALAVFVPFAVAGRLLGLLTSVEVSPAGIWHWVQQAGTRAMQQLEGELQALAQGHSPVAERLESDVARLPLLVGGDGGHGTVSSPPRNPSGQDRVARGQSGDSGSAGLAYDPQTQEGRALAPASSGRCEGQCSAVSGAA